MAAAPAFPPVLAGPGWAVWWPGRENRSRVEWFGTEIPVTKVAADVPVSVDDVGDALRAEVPSDMWVRIAFGLFSVLLALTSAVASWVVKETLSYRPRIVLIERQLHEVHSFHSAVAQKLELPAPPQPAAEQLQVVEAP